ncbi:MAG: exodeoxyribonuclease VII large subunit [Methanobrevibacter thaueri]|nr:exodeoxyribonuclease VII large subunit [Methanobrevibacter thaueri]
MKENTFTVSQINALIKKKLTQTQSFKNILVKGEISNYSTSHIGHSYFTLKDEKSKINVMISKFNKRRFLKFKPENGMQVIVKGSIDVYETDGKYQLNVVKITEDGVGELHIALEQLKKKLKNEGLFDDTHKKKIPKYPKRIGVVTAKSGAVVKDVITTVKRRYPICEILVFPTLVQGDKAAPQIVRQIKHAQKYDLDTLIIGRGGGSIEELWPFNEEIVAREIYNCKIPTISAIGHEVNFAITDFVADKRAATPTAAAELAVPELTKIKDHVNQLNRQSKKSIKDKLSLKKSRLNTIRQKKIIKNPETIYNIKSMHFDSIVNKLGFSSKTIIEKNKNKLIRLESANIFKNPQSIYEKKSIKLNSLINNIGFSSKTIIEKNKNKLIRLENSGAFKNPESLYMLKKINLKNTVNKLTFASTNMITDNKNKLFKIENNHILKNPDEILKNKRDIFLKNINKLEVLNPLLTLKRGYSIAKLNDKVISSVEDVEVGDEVDIEFDDGIINTKVI